MQPTRTIIESPLKGRTPEEFAENQAYARACMRDSLARGEAPFASHLLYAQPGVLDDDVPAERTQGIEAGLAWAASAERTAVYLDLGTSSGMELGISHARDHDREIVYRRLHGQWGTIGARRPTP